MTGPTRRRLLELAGAASMAAAAAAGARAEGVSPGPRSEPAGVPFAHRTPLRIGAVSLVVQDLERMTAYYRDVLGLAVIERGEGQAKLEAGGAVLLVLEHKPSAPFEARGSAGLFHTAFLMPTRRDLARWLVHVASNRVRLTGFSDHSVSEAIYLDDPEGNGIEVYADRPPEQWRWEAGSVIMSTEQLDIDNLVSLTNIRVNDYAGAPEGLRIGHVHLRVGDLTPAGSFYAAIGMAPTRQRSGAAFMSSGRYHHHLGLNVWQSRGAGQRDASATGLGWFSLEAENADMLAAQERRLREAGLTVTAMAGGVETADPWGTRVRLATR
jgi:catechol 2,3-dioxygenase